VTDSPAKRPGFGSWLRHPRTTVRWRLTLLYGGMFLACGAGLLAVTYELVSHNITGSGGITLHRAPGGKGASSGSGTILPPPPRLARAGPGLMSTAPTLALERLRLTVPGVPAGVGRILESSAGQEFLRLVETDQQVSELHQLEIESGVALAIMTVISLGLGWVIAGRVLQPLRAITAATQRISEQNLHERLAIGGPPDELRRLADTIDGLLARLEAAFEAQRRFVANASHELRTPLTTMRTALDVALSKPQLSAQPQVKALDASLREDLDQADRLLESSLVLARAQRGALGEATSVSLAQIVGDALARRGEAIAAKRIELHRTLRPASVAGSATLLTRMVENLIDNAVRHNVPDGLINVTCEADRDAARLVVESGGSVLDRGAVAQLSEPFRRIGAERTGSQNGHGLGLSIVAAIGAAHGGTFRLYAREQGGLGAVITLPVTPDRRSASGPA
jgi:signal transduction histidine kinase